jgi:hypothetical protein
MIKKVLTKYWQLIIIIVLLIALFMSVRSCNVNADSTKVASHIADSSFLVAKYYQGKNGELIGQVNTHKLTIKDLKQFGNQLGFDNAELKAQVGNLKNLVAHWEGKARTGGTIQTVLHDTTFVEKSGEKVLGKTSNWNNKYLDIHAVLVNNDLTITYLYNVDFDLTAYRKPKRGFWKPPGQLVADIKFSDPNFKVQEFKGFVVQEPRKRWYQTTAAKIGFGAIVGGYAVYKIGR